MIWFALIYLNFKLKGKSKFTIYYNYNMAIKYCKLNIMHATFG